MLWEKLELGAVALRVLSWVVIPNLRFSKAGKEKKKKKRLTHSSEAKHRQTLARGQAPREQMWVFLPPAVQWVDIQVKAETVEPALCSEVTSKFAIKEQKPVL